ncbi:hypothetical protein [Martelella mediterranea]|nr:hypothetical protein [Martelella mediterranea]
MDRVNNSKQREKNMNWVPVVLGLFKLGVIGTTIFFAIKSHRDGEKEQKQKASAGPQYVPSEPTAVGAPKPE